MPESGQTLWLPVQSGCCRRAVFCPVFVGLCMLFVGSCVGAGGTFVMMKELSVQADLPTPVAPPCGTCKAENLQGRYKGFLDIKKKALGIVVEVSYNMVHTFHKDGTVDVELDPVINPGNMIQAFNCTGVPHTVDETTCQVNFTNPCLEKFNKRNEITAMKYLWDGKKNLTVYESMKDSFFSSTFVWYETPEAEESTGVALVAQAPACSADGPQGKYTGYLDIKQKALGIMVEVSYNMIHTFHKDTVDVELVPVKNPGGMIAAFTCADVPRTVNTATCEVAFSNDCIVKFNKRNEVTSMKYVWNGANNLTVSEAMKDSFFSHTYVWNEEPTSTGVALIAQAPACGADGPQGKYTGFLDIKQKALGIMVEVSYNMIHTFHKDTVDVELVPVKNPGGMIAAFTCADVPRTINTATCEVTFSNDCIVKYNKRNEITSMKYVWDGGKNLTVSEAMKDSFFSHTYVWNEAPASTGALLSSHVAAPTPPPVNPPTGPCKVENLEGRFFGYCDIVNIKPNDFTLCDVPSSMEEEFVSTTTDTTTPKMTVSYNMIHTFKNGAADIEFVPRSNPGGMLAGVNCSAVPVTVDPSTCEVTLAESACMTAFFKRDEIISMKYMWDGKQNLTVFETMKDSLFTSTFVWNEIVKSDRVATIFA